MFDTVADLDDDVAVLLASGIELYDTTVTAARCWLDERLLALRIERAHGPDTREFAECAVRTETGGSLEAARTLLGDAHQLESLPLTRAGVRLGLLTAHHGRAVLRVLTGADDDLTRRVEAQVLGRWLGPTLLARAGELPRHLAAEVDEALLLLAPPAPTAGPASAPAVTPACLHEQQTLALALPAPRATATPARDVAAPAGRGTGTGTSGTAAATAPPPALRGPAGTDERPPFCAGRTPGDLARALTRVLRRLDADDVDRRRRDTHADRFLGITPESDTGLSTVSFLTDDLDAARIRQQAYAIARARHAAGLGSPDGLDATANDVVRDHLLALGHPDPAAELARLAAGGLPDRVATRRPVQVTVLIPHGSAPTDPHTERAGHRPPVGGAPVDGDSTQDPAAREAGGCPWDLADLTALLGDRTPLHPEDLAELLVGATVRRATTDPAGRVTAVDDRATLLPPHPDQVAAALTAALSLPLPTPPAPTGAHDPTVGTARVVDSRWRHCAAPGCRRPAEQCDRDHRTPHAVGGPTCPCNLWPLCRHHHRAKQAGWTPALHPDGSTTWTSPHGRATRHPPPWADDHL